MPPQLAAMLARLGIPHTTTAHRPIFTVAEGEDLKKSIAGGHTKNLFLKDKKGALYLITALWDTTIDLKTLPPLIGAQRISFGSPDLLLTTLGVTPGSVTPLALLNDTENRVTFILDQRIMDCTIVNCHPLRNDMTTSLAPNDLLRFVAATGHTAQMMIF